MSYVTTMKARGEQAGIYVTTPGRTNGLSGLGSDCRGVQDFLQLGDFYDADGGMAARRLPIAKNLSTLLTARPTYAKGGGDLGVPIAAGATWFGLKPQNVPQFKQQGLAGVFDGVLSALGLLDVINQEYPNMTMAAAYKAEKGKVDEHKRVLAGLRSATAKSVLARQLSSISGSIDSLAGAFEAPDSQIGKREKDKFAQAILDHRTYTKAWRDAKKQYGFSDPITGETEGPPPQAPPSASPLAVLSDPETPWALYIAGGLAIAAGAALLTRKSRRRSA